MMEQTTEAFDIVDFTTSSDWERYEFFDDVSDQINLFPFDAQVHLRFGRNN